MVLSARFFVTLWLKTLQMIGLPSFQTEAIFAPSLLVTIRRRLDLTIFQAFDAIIIEKNNEILVAHKALKKNKQQHQALSNTPLI